MLNLVYIIDSMSSVLSSIYLEDAALYGKGEAKPHRAD